MASLDWSARKIWVCLEQTISVKPFNSGDKGSMLKAKHLGETFIVLSKRQVNA
jgi:hypothetical protein